MPSFSKMSVFPVGYFRAASAWLLRERRDVATRIQTITTELARIGFVKVTYIPIIEGDSVKRSEVRKGFSVSRESSLGRLVQAYIATGGNPFDISGFLHPDLTSYDGDPSNPAINQEYPFGGLTSPKSVEYNNPLPEVTDSETGTENPEKTGYEGYEGGMMPSDRYYPGRQGGRVDRGAWDSDTVVRTMHEIRGWNNQAIKLRLQNIEWQIIKLSDLHEQLSRERDEVLVQAFGGTLDGVGEFDSDQFDERNLVQAIVQDMYKLLFQTDSNNLVTGFAPNDEVGFLVFTFPNEPSEDSGDLG